jgi:hypothetical protein
MLHDVQERSERVSGWMSWMSIPRALQTPQRKYSKIDWAPVHHAVKTPISYYSNAGTSSSPISSLRESPKWTDKQRPSLHILPNNAQLVEIVE